VIRLESKERFLLRTLLVPAWVLALFDGDDQAGDSSDNQGASRSDARTDSRNDRSDSRGDARDTASDRSRFDSEQSERIYNALEKQRKQTKEAERAAKDAKAQIDELAPKAAMVDVMVQRAIRLEARDALREAGVLHPDVVDLFLAKSPEVKIDDKTGEVVGISDSLAKFKVSHAPLFKLVDAKADDKADDKAADDKKADDKKSDDKKADDGKADDKKADDQKRNATATGRTPAGQSGGTNNSGLPDLRGMTPAQRKAAITAYKQSLNVQ
jgi:hypothetical protein